MPKSLYVHVPFCEQICHYCDFNKFYLKNQPVDEYLKLCREEMERTVHAFPQNAPLSTVYVGGGTPTSLTTAQLEYLLKAIADVFAVDDNAEWTVEVNPGSADKEKMLMMKDRNVNRLSIGAQTFDTKLLKAINRDHAPGDVSETVNMSHEAGISNLSVDMMFGLPGQTMAQWEESLNEVCRLPVNHISAYSLKVEEKTVFYQLLRKGKLPLPGEETEADMYRWMLEKLKAEIFTHYEISNFAKKGFESRHNLTYWNNEEYYGAGAGAHSYVHGTRRANHGPLPKYMDALKRGGLPHLEEHEVSLKEQMEEFMFMGLRKTDGVSLEEFKTRYHADPEKVFPGAINDLRSKGLIVRAGNRIMLSEKGLLLANNVFEKFLLEE